VPHSNFDPELEITANGGSIAMGGPLRWEDDDGELVSVVISAFVTQEPDQRTNPPVPQQGATGAGSVTLGRSDVTLAEPSWECSAESQGGSFREDWAFASAELVEKAPDGAIEKYTWSQWVWLRHP
jgi:hypothetical protein